MVQARLRPSHRIRQASGPTRPAPVTLAQYWKSFTEQDPKDVVLRYRSAQWDDIIDDQPSPVVSEVEDFDSDQESIEAEWDSPVGNLTGKPPPPTHHVPLRVAAAQPTVPLPDEEATAILRDGANLPPPRSAPAVLLSTPTSPLMDQVIQDLLLQGILQPEPHIVNAFRMFLVAKSDQSARPILDISPWTSFYDTPPMRLYSAAEVLVALPQNGRMIKIDIRAGFFQIDIHPRFRHFYGVYYNQKRYAWTRLPMGHPLAPSIMQHVATAVARYLHAQFGLSMVAYLDDWLLFGPSLPVSDIMAAIQRLGLTVNKDKSVLTLTTTLVYLGLSISTTLRTIRPTPTCLQHLMDLVSIVPQASRQDLQRIAGYMAWLTYAMGWPRFLASLIYNWSTYWITVFHNTRYLHRPRRLQAPLFSRQLYTDATPTSGSRFVCWTTTAVYCTGIFRESCNRICGNGGSLMGTEMVPTTLLAATNNTYIVYRFISCLPYNCKGHGDHFAILGPPSIFVYSDVL
jgi:hypothetical protein